MEAAFACAQAPAAPRRSGWRRTLLSSLLGLTLAMSPLLIGSAPTTDMSLLVAMATMTDVRDSLEEKRMLLEGAVRRAGELGRDSAELAQLQGLCEVHFRNARDIQGLAVGFLGTSSQRYPDFGKYWDNYRQRLIETWTQIRKHHEAIVAFAPGAQVAPPAPTPVAASPAPAKRDVSSETASSRTSEQQELLAVYREAYKRYSDGTVEALQDARGRFEKLLAREPAFHLARYWLARILLTQGHPVQAREHARTLVADQPGLKMAKSLLAEAEKALKRGRGPATATAMRGRTRLMPFMSSHAVASRPLPEEP